MSSTIGDGDSISRRMRTSFNLHPRHTIKPFKSSRVRPRRGPDHELLRGPRGGLQGKSRDHEGMKIHRRAAVPGRPAPVANSSSSSSQRRTVAASLEKPPRRHFPGRRTEPSQRQRSKGYALGDSPAGVAVESTPNRRGDLASWACPVWPIPS